MSDLPKPLKESDLVALATCVCCRKKIGQTGIPIFYVVTLERHAIDIGAVRRKTGLEMQLGSAWLASAMGPNEDMTKPISLTRATVCTTCSLNLSVAEIDEISFERKQEGPTKAEGV